LIFSSLLSLWWKSLVEKSQSIEKNCTKIEKKKHMHTGKELEAHWVEKGYLSCDSDAPQVDSARSDWTTVVRVNRRKTNRRKTRPYCISRSHVPLVFRNADVSFSKSFTHILQNRIIQSRCAVSLSRHHVHIILSQSCL
jgi:hypothetical protein